MVKGKGQGVSGGVLGKEIGVEIGLRCLGVGGFWMWLFSERGLKKVVLMHHNNC